MSGNFANGFGSSPAGGVAANVFTGSSTLGFNGGPGINIEINTGCNTNANSPCLIFGASFEYMAVGKYIISDTITNPISNSIPLNVMTLNPQNQTTSEIYYCNFNALYSLGTTSNPSTNVILNITHVDSVGENISGTFGGTIQKITYPNLNTPQLIHISGSFNFYRQS